MSGRVIKEVANGAKRVSILLAEEVQDRGFKRVIDAIEPQRIAQTAEEVANAFKGSKLMTQSQKEGAARIIIAYKVSQGHEKWHSGLHAIALCHILVQRTPKTTPPSM